MIINTISEFFMFQATVKPLLYPVFRRLLQMKFVSRIFSVLLALLLAASAVTAAYAASIDLGVVINKDLESEGTITVTVDNSESTNAVLQNSPAKLEIPCIYDYAKVFYGEQVVEGSVLDTVNDKITFPVARGGMYTIRKQTAHTVTFNVNEGSTVTAQTVVEGGKVEEPTDPTKQNYIFAGWYKESTFTTEWDFEKNTVTANTTLYAKWLEAVTVTFNSNGGSTVTSQTVAKDSKLTKPTDPAKQNYFFDGWYKESSLTTEWDFDDDTVSTSITLYAKWDTYSFKSTSYRWSKNSNRTLTIKIVDEGQVDLLDSVIINDSVVESKYYEVTADGTTINIKLKPGYLQKLPVKNGYSIRVTFLNGGVAETQLNILKASGNVSTGDMFRIGLWATLLVGSVAGVAALLIFRKRKK